MSVNLIVYALIFICLAIMTAGCLQEWYLVWSGKIPHADKTTEQDIKAMKNRGLTHIAFRRYRRLHPELSLDYAWKKFLSI